METVSLGERITLLRNRKKLSKKQLSEITGIHATNISKYELGQSVPTLDVLKKISSALDASLDYLILNKHLPDIHDKQLLALTENIDKLSENDKDFIKNTLSNYLQSKASPKCRT